MKTWLFVYPLTSHYFSYKILEVPETAITVEGGSLSARIPKVTSSLSGIELLALWTSSLETAVWHCIILHIYMDFNFAPLELSWTRSSFIHITHFYFRVHVASRFMINLDGLESVCLYVTINHYELAYSCRFKISFNRMISLYNCARVCLDYLQYAVLLIM